ncbi:glucose-6-phosphate isomerase [Myroides sp. DF42-4-2]|uniref:glucose-6-phosphate isomerase n=1 Tax=unclassified Myroides TaxID=2642485 RepID=UPI0025756A6E|nr:glucose-6-phosphate isomerase [Myroides sp. DF42-4-2]MDM1406128.1 glucose-6-phosphate isomerase [Myroides sp. DF42-4-2]
MLQTINPTSTAAWSKLREHFEQMKLIQMQDLFKEDSSRGSSFNIQFDDFLLDYSKNKVTKETLAYLCELGEEMHLKEAIEDLFTGRKLNKTEDRAVLHTALRDFNPNASIVVDGVNILDEIRQTRDRMKDFVERVIQGEYTSSTGEPFTDIVNIGIGGSDLGPKMVVQGLANYSNQLNVHFISNVDDDYLYAVLRKLNPETTLVLVVSKTFTTQETVLNADKVVEWLKTKVKKEKLGPHLVGVTAEIDRAVAYGIQPETIFPMWDHIGGRFSLWSSVGLSIALAIGYENFERLLKGANKMDVHFRTAHFEQNIPVVCALLSVWYNNFFGYETEAVVPYSQFLERFPAHLQQMIMESNGKDKNREGNPVNYETGTLIWGDVGVSAQHAFFQLFHQGTKVVPVDFIGFINPYSASDCNHTILMSNFFGQTEALLNGKDTTKETETENPLVQNFREFQGNKPSNTLLIDKLTPESLGALVALYEHKTFVQGVIWNIYSFDQFGVEYGKVLAKNIQGEIISNNVLKHDSSTAFLLNYYLRNRTV